MRVERLRESPQRPRRALLRPLPLERVRLEPHRPTPVRAGARGPADERAAARPAHGRERRPPRRRAGARRRVGDRRSDRRRLVHVPEPPAERVRGLDDDERRGEAEPTLDAGQSGREVGGGRKEHGRFDASVIIALPRMMRTPRMMMMRHRGARRVGDEGRREDVRGRLGSVVQGDAVRVAAPVRAVVDPRAEAEEVAAAVLGAVAPRAPPPQVVRRRPEPPPEVRLDGRGQALPGGLDAEVEVRAGVRRARGEEGGGRGGGGGARWWRVRGRRARVGPAPRPTRRGALVLGIVRHLHRRDAVDERVRAGARAGGGVVVGEVVDPGRVGEVADRARARRHRERRCAGTGGEGRREKRRRRSEQVSQRSAVSAPPMMMSMNERAIINQRIA